MSGFCNTALKYIITLKPEADVIKWAKKQKKVGIALYIVIARFTQVFHYLIISQWNLKMHTRSMQAKCCKAKCWGISVAGIKSCFVSKRTDHSQQLGCIQICIQQIQQSPRKVCALADKDDEMTYSKVFVILLSQYHRKESIFQQTSF